jgi:hypothetical protein
MIEPGLAFPSRTRDEGADSTELTEVRSPKGG